MLLSVFLISTSSFEIILADTAGWQQDTFFTDLRFFLLATFQFIPMFFDAYKEVQQKGKITLASIGNVIHLCMANIHQVEHSLSNETKSKPRTFSWKANSILLLLILTNLYLLSLSN